MAYIGKKVEETELDNRTVDTMTGDGSDTTMSLSATPISVNNVLVFLNGVMQRPTTDFTLSGSTITFAAAPFTGAVVVAITGEGGHIGRPSSPLPTEKFMNSAVTNAKISGVAASKLTGSLPALDGAALTGGPDPYTESTSDPAINTNPSTGVGTFWVNKSSGEAFCLTDATAGENVWTNIGGGDGDVQPWMFQGTISGYTTGGQDSTAPGNQPSSNIIDKFSFTSDGNATDHGDLISPSNPNQGNSSTTHGYVCGGRNQPTVGAMSALIHKFAFATSGNSSNVGTLTLAREYSAGQSSENHGYNSAGINVSTSSDIIDKFTFASDGNASDVGDVTVARFGPAGQSSTTHGYTSGSLPVSNIIDKFPFASNANATDVGDLFLSRGYSTGQSSTTHGYTSSSHSNAGNNNTIDKFTFASNNNATDVGDLSVGRYGPAGQSSTTHGYTSGGADLSNVIDKFTFSSDANATDVGDITDSRGFTSGHQY